MRHAALLLGIDDAADAGPDASRALFAAVLRAYGQSVAMVLAVKDPCVAFAVAWLQGLRSARARWAAKKLGGTLGQLTS